MTTIREQLSEALRENGETAADVVACTATDAELDSDTAGFLLWTNRYVYYWYQTEYDNGGHVTYLARNPPDVVGTKFTDYVPPPPPAPGTVHLTPRLTDTEIEQAKQRGREAYEKTKARLQAKPAGRKSEHPCEKCGAMQVYVETSNKDKPYYQITCHACGETSRVDAEDA